MEELTIHIFIDGEGEYQYSIYDCPPDEIAEHSPVDGGVCNMSMSTALGIALDTTRTYLRRLKL